MCSVPELYCVSGHLQELLYFTASIIDSGASSLESPAVTGVADAVVDQLTSLAYRLSLRPCGVDAESGVTP